MRLPEEPETPFQINIIPMIDVIFAILAFFIVSSLFLTRSPSSGLPINLPTAKTAQPQPVSQITVTLDRTGQLWLNKKLLPLKSLPSQLKARIGNQSVLVVIQADAGVPHGTVVSLMDTLRQMPNVRLAIAAKQ